VKDDKKPWNRRWKRPFVPGNKREAEAVIKKVVEIGGFPPLKYLLKLVKGGSPWK